VTGIPRVTSPPGKDYPILLQEASKISLSLDH
jgi:hypothetical protein